MRHQSSHIRRFFPRSPVFSRMNHTAHTHMSIEKKPYICSEPFARTAHLLEGPGSFTRQPIEHIGRARLLDELSSQWDRRRVEYMGRPIYLTAHLVAGTGAFTQRSNKGSILLDT